MASEKTIPVAGQALLGFHIRLIVLVSNMIGHGFLRDVGGDCDIAPPSANLAIPQAS